MAKKYKISLRQRKYAQTKIALAKAAEERIRYNRLDEISVRELCDTIPVSEVTFYNYFPQKSDLLLYIMQLWQLEIHWYLHKWEPEKSNLEQIEAFFEFAGQGFEEYPLVMNEILAFFVQRRGDVCFEELSVAEKLVAYPELKGIEHIQIPRYPKQEGILKVQIQRAIATGELPKELSADSVSNMLGIILLGGLMTLHEKNPTQIRATYRWMLKMLWKGLWAEVTEEEESTTLHVLKMT
jgi:AcrR family transcriptional regulator